MVAFIIKHYPQILKVIRDCNFAIWIEANLEKVFCCPHLKKLIDSRCRAFTEQYVSKYRLPFVPDILTSGLVMLLIVVVENC